MDHTPKVALLIETSRGYGRELLRGIVRYARLHGPWAFYVTPGDFRQALPKMEQWGGTGIIARIETPTVAKAILATGLPTIALDLSEQQAAESPLARFCEIHPDAEKAAQLAAEHLLERGFKSFAYVGIPGRVWSKRREEAFCRSVGRTNRTPTKPESRPSAEGTCPTPRKLVGDGPKCEVYQPPQRKHQREWAREQAVMADWLRALPKPVGLMACNDDRGRQVLEACRAADIRVPEEVAVVGMDNDELLCDLSDPPLSSVALNAQRGGYQAAALLDELMSGRTNEPRQILVEPLWVVTRRSSDVMALGDPEVAAAMRFIRDNAGRPIQVSDVIRSVALARRTLEIRFRDVVGRSVHAEIQRVQLEKAQRLLMETDLPTSKVAEASGFSSASYLGLVFRRELGMTPARYRTHIRSR